MSLSIWISRAVSSPTTAARAYRDRIVTTTRIGVAYAAEWAKRRLRFYVRDNPNVSMRNGRPANRARIEELHAAREGSWREE